MHHQDGMLLFTVLVGMSGHRIPSTHTSYDPLSYVITHLHGDKGWTYDIPFAHKKGKRNNVSAAEYYTYRLHTRDPPGLDDIIQDTLTYGGILKQQYLCDQYVKVEEERLNYQRFNQAKLKAETYSGLQDAVAANEHREAGRYVVLSSSFTGSPRHNHQLYQDAMAAVRKMGKPDLFITFTCNPNWREIVEELRFNEKPQDRNDLIARVFKMKLDALLHDLTKGNILGKCISHTAVIEFQKRGLPHAHILLILASEDKPFTADDYDKIVCSEIPDPNASDIHSRLHGIVTKHMLHGPCGVHNPNCVCMDKETMTCSKKFPKNKIDSTSNEEDQYPQYRRRCLSSYRKLNANGDVIFEFDDSWVVPYNPYLCLKYDCHINVEICNSVSAVKYLYKYVYKGHDKATIAVIPYCHGEQPPMNNAPIIIDEIKKYTDSRYIGASEAVWRIFGFDMSSRYPAICRLQIHEEGGHTVFFEEGDEAQALATGLLKRTTLTAYFDKVREESDVPLTEVYLGKNDVGEVILLHQSSHTRIFQHSTLGTKINGKDEFLHTKVIRLDEFITFTQMLVRNFICACFCAK